jgi:hypothetical protein
LSAADEEIGTPVVVHEICESASSVVAKVFSNMKESFNTSAEVCGFFVTN